MLIRELEVTLEVPLVDCAVTCMFVLTELEETVGVVVEVALGVPLVICCESDIEELAVIDVVGDSELDRLLTDRTDEVELSTMEVEGAGDPEDVPEVEAPLVVRDVAKDEEIGKGSPEPVAEGDM